MQATLSFVFNNLEELHDFTAKMAVPIAAQINLPAPAVAAPEPAVPAKNRKTKTAKVEAPESDPETQVHEVADEPAPDLEAVRAAITAVNDKFGLVPARRVMKKFGVARVTELKPEQYADFIKACGEVK